MQILAITNNDDTQWYIAADVQTQQVRVIKFLLSTKYMYVCLYTY